MSFHPTFFGKNLDQALWQASSELDMEPWNLEYRSSTVDGGFVMVEVLNVPLIETEPVVPVPSKKSQAEQQEAAKEPSRLSAGEVPSVPTDGSYVDTVRAVLQELLERTGLPCAPKIEEREGSIFVDMGEEHAARLLERDGRLLDSLQHLVNRMVHQQRPGGPTVQLDAMGRIAGRERNLETMARRVADLAAAVGGPVSIETLPAPDRKTVHAAVASRSDVRTESDGMGAYRRLVMRPR